jgi:hypothetical protein
VRAWRERKKLNVNVHKRELSYLSFLFKLTGEDLWRIVLDCSNLRFQLWAGS